MRGRASGKIAIARVRVGGRIAWTLSSRSVKFGSKLRSACLPTRGTRRDLDRGTRWGPAHLRCWAKFRNLTTFRASRTSDSKTTRLIDLVDIESAYGRVLLTGEPRASRSARQSNVLSTPDNLLSGLDTMAWPSLVCGKSHLDELLKQIFWRLHFFATVAKGIILTITYGESTMLPLEKCRAGASSVPRPRSS